MEPGTVARLLHHRAPWCDRDVARTLVTLALEIAREGQEGRPVGTLFTLGRADEVLRSSRPLILDPLSGHDADTRHLSQPNLRGTVKALAQLDGAFVVSDDGLIAGACRYLDIPAVDVSLPLGLGTRHFAAAAVSKHLRVLAIAVSKTGIVRIFCDGECILQLPDGNEDRQGSRKPE